MRVGSSFKMDLREQQYVRRFKRLIRTEYLHEVLSPHMYVYTNEVKVLLFSILIMTLVVSPMIFGSIEDIFKTSYLSSQKRSGK